MKRLLFAPLALAVVLSTGFVTSGFAGAQGEEYARLSSEDLKNTLTGMGYELKQIGKEPGKEKWEFSVKTTSFNIPIGAEVSGSKHFIWLTVSLGQISDKHDPKELLRLGAKVQPTQVYLSSKDNLMMAFAVDNRSVSPALLKVRIEKLTQDVENAASVWNKG
jgi:hypothetical protein